MSPPILTPELERLAVVCPSWVGDVTMATPVLRAFRRCLPRTRIVLVLRPALPELLEGLDFHDDVVVDDKRGWRDPFRLGAILRGHQPEAALLLPNSMRSALLAWRAGAGVRVGYRRQGRGPLLTHALPPPREAPFPTRELYARLAEAVLGGEQIDRTLELRVTPENAASADALLADLEGRPFVLLNPGANDPGKRWPPERFAAAAEAIVADLDCGVAVTGAPAERSIVRSIVESFSPGVRERTVDLAAKGGGLGPLKAVVERARLLLTNDTGPRHLAVALRTPVVTLFGPTDFRWTRLDCPWERVVVANPDLPAHLTANERPRECAIDRIAVETVVDAARELLAIV